MRKNFTRFLCALAVGAAGVMQSWGATDSQGKFIYLIGDINGWLQPIKENSGQFEDYKMYETSPGSNVFARHFDTLSQYGSQKAWLRFQTDLYEPVDESDAYNAWNYYVIGPMVDSYELSRNSYTGVLTADKAKEYRVMSGMGAGSWCVDNIGGTLVVDLNRQTVSMFDETECFIIMEGEGIPTLETYQDFRGAVSTFYKESGDFSFELYALLQDDHWLNNYMNDNADISSENGYANAITSLKNAYADRRDSFNVTGWKGGLFDLCLRDGIFPDPVFYLTLTPESGLQPEDIVYVFTPEDKLRPWAGCDRVVSDHCLTLFKDGEGNYSGVVDVESLSKGFNICLEPGGKNQPAKTVLAPSTAKDLELVMADGLALSSGELKSGSVAGYWKLPENLPSTVVLTVTTGSNPSIKIDANVEPYQVTGIYLRGGMNDWATPDEWEFVTTGVADTWILLNKQIAAGTEFKVADAVWGNINLGAPDMFANEISPNQPYGLYVTSYNLLLNTDFDGDIILRRSGSQYTLELQQPGQGMILAPEPETGIFIYDEPRGRIESMTYNTKTGMYQEQVYVAPHKSCDLHIFTRKLPITSVEPGWETSYALQASGNAPYTFELDEFGVGETDFTVREEMTTDKATAPLTIYNDDSGTPYFTVNVDMEARKIYIERAGDNAYLCGELAGGKVPNLRNRNEFKDLRVYFAGSVIDLPAGDVRYDIAASLSDGAIVPSNTVFETTPDESGYTQFFTDDLNRYFRSVFIKGWKGGKVWMDFISMIDLEKYPFVKVNAHSDRGDSDFTLNVVESNSGKYSGRISYEDGSGNKSFDLKLTDNTSSSFWEENGIYINIPQHRGNYNFNSGLENLVDYSGSIQVPIGKYGSSYHLPTLTGACDLEMTVDLEKGELSIEIISGETSSVYEVVADEDSGIDGVVAYPSQSQENTVTLEGSIAGSGDGDGSEVEFNFTAPDGTTVTPASGQDTEITFDGAGFWTGDVVVSGNRNGSRKVARSQAENGPKWRITLPDGMDYSKLAMKLDNKKGKLTIQSSAHNKGYFIINDLEKFSLENMESLKQSMLVESSTPGVYEGIIHFNDNNDSDRSNRVGFMSGVFSWTLVTPGISLPIYSDTMYAIDLLSENASCQRMAWSRNELGHLVSAGVWNVRTISNDVNVRFDSNASTLSFSIDAAGVENVSADSSAEESLRVIPGQGNVTVISSAALTMPIYSITGVMVKAVNLHPGETVIDLPAGYYIAAGHKLLVR